MPTIKFPKQERITFLLRKDLADKLPAENPDRRNFLNRAVEHELGGRVSAASIMGSAKSELKTTAARENAKKPRPRKKPINGIDNS